MPTTFTGLLLFVVLLLPGFAYLVGKERAGTERRTSPFRETVSIVAASVTTELVVTLAAWPLWAISIDTSRLLIDPEAEWKAAPGRFVVWGLGLLVAAVALAYAATLPTVRRLGRRFTGTYPHPSSVSAWWMLFEEYRHGSDRHVGLLLDDGSYLQGTLISFNQNADDIPDRDLLLTAPITYRASGAAEASALDCGAACISARRVVAMTVAYVSPVIGRTPSPNPTLAGQAEGSAAAPAEAG